jgi:hypothetical protein
VGRGGVVARQWGGSVRRTALCCAALSCGDPPPRTLPSTPAQTVSTRRLATHHARTLATLIWISLAGYMSAQGQGQGAGWGRVAGGAAAVSTVLHLEGIVVDGKYIRLNTRAGRCAQQACASCRHTNQPAMGTHPTACIPAR